MGEELKAATLGEVVLHLNYLKDAILEVGRQVREQSTTMATKAELDALRAEMHQSFIEVRAEIKQKTVSGWFNNTLSLITRVGAAVTALIVMIGLAVAVVRYVDRGVLMAVAPPAPAASK